MSTSPTSDAPRLDRHGYEFDDSPAQPGDTEGFAYLKTPKDSPYVMTSPSDSSKTRLSLERFRIWCAMGQYETTGEVLHLTDEQENDASYDPVLTGSNRAQEWQDGQAYFFVTARKILKDKLGTEKIREDIQIALEDYRYSVTPPEFPTFEEAQDSGLTTEYFVFADEEVRELTFTTFRDNFDTLLAEAEQEIANLSEKLQ